MAERETVSERAVLAALTRAVIATSIDGTIIYWNAGAEVLLGWARDDVLGRNIIEVLVPRMLSDEATSIMTTVLAGETWRGDWVVTHADGTPRRLQVVDSPLLDENGAVIGIVGESEDITDLRVAEAALSDSRDTLRLALDAGRMGIWRWDALTNLTVWDETLEQLFGLEPGTFDGSFDMYVSCIHPDDRDKVLTVVQNAMDTKGNYRIEHRVLHRDGSVHWVDCRGLVLVDETGTATGTIGCSVETTEARESRDSIEAAHVRLADLSATLQEGLLPHLEEVDGFEVVVRYRPGEQRMLLGGDFVDLTRTSGGNLGFVIGDVAGHGPAAAALGASLRAAWRALALTSNDPGAWLHGLERVLCSSCQDTEMFASVLTGTISTSGEVRLASAGHPHPVLVAVDGAHAVVTDPALPLGFDPARSTTETTALLPDGATLVCFTDGLFEGRVEPGSPERYGVERVTDWLARRRPDQIDGVVIDALLHEVEMANGALLSDDVAVLSVTRRRSSR